MSVTTYVLIGITYYIFAIVIIVVVLNLINKKERQKYQEQITTLERDKNLIISASILTELNKVEALVNNDKMQENYNEWHKKFNEIKDQDIPKITDELIVIEDLFNDKKYKELEEKIAHAELQIYYIKSKANFLLDEIKEITLSEERNRESITKLKVQYREIVAKYNNNLDDYQEVASPLELQFENVDKLFSGFEVAMENNSYQEVGRIVKAIDDTIGNLGIIIEEAPSIILMANKLIPKKMQDIKNISEKMIKEGYNLDYLNLDYNFAEAEKKISDIIARLNVLNVLDSTFELKTMSDYFDSIYNDFDKERISKKTFEEYTRTILIKANKLEKVNNNLYKKIDALKYSYDLSDEDLKIIDVIRTDLKNIKKDYENIIGAHRSKTFAYTRISKEMELLNVRLIKVSDKLELALKTLGSLKEDENRAREQLEEIKDILKKSKERINSYKLPIIPKIYYVQLGEATDAVKEIIKELEKKPISIKKLNLRVDTARDLTLKLYNTTNETVKTAQMAEFAIVYGNRYRSTNSDIDLGITKAENYFYKGDFKSSLESSINSINIIEPGIHGRLLESVQK